MIGTLAGAAFGLGVAAWAWTRARRLPPDLDLTSTLAALGLEEVQSGSTLFRGTRRVWGGALHGVPVSAVPTDDGRLVVTLGHGPGADVAPVLLRPARPSDVSFDWRQRWLVDDELAARLESAGEAHALNALHPVGFPLPAWIVRDGVVRTVDPIDRLDAETLCRLAALERLLTRDPSATTSGEAWWLSLLTSPATPAPARDVAFREIAARAARSPRCAAVWTAQIEGPDPEPAVRAALTEAPAPVAGALRRLADDVLDGKRIAPPSLAGALIRVAGADDAPRLLAALSPETAPPDGLLDLLVRIGDATTAARLPALSAGWPSADRSRAAQVVAALVEAHGAPEAGGLTLPRAVGELTVATAAGALTQPETAR